MKNFNVHDCHIVPLDTISGPEGHTITVKGEETIPFDVKRIYYLYDIPEGGSRGAHAHEDLYQLIVATGGSFDMLLDDGVNKRVVKLNQPNYGLYVVPGIWRELIDFSYGAVCLVLASLTYEDNIVIRDYDDFRKFKNLDQK